jgi:ferredoxin-NADP reductase
MRRLWRPDWPFSDLVGSALSSLAAALVRACGSNSFVEAAADGLIANGIAASAIRTERFGV